MGEATRFLDLAALSGAKPHDSPFWWTLCEHTFRSRDHAEALRASFPTDGYREFVRTEGSKRHHLIGRHLVERGSSAAPAPSASLPAPWASFASELLSPEYRATLAAMSGAELGDTGVEITLWRQGQGGFIDPHPDNPEKVLVHLIYLSDEDWSVAFGGCLRLLRSSSIDDVAAEVPPRLGTSIVFRRSDRSWHAYTPISAPDRLRLAVQVVFHRESLSYGSDEEYPS